MRKKLILLSALALHSSLTLYAAQLASFDEIERVVSEGSMTTLSSPGSPTYTFRSDEEEHAQLFRTHSSLLNMTKEQREKLAQKLGETKRSELEKAIPPDKQDALEQKHSCCFIFWRSVFRISSKTLGSLAIDLILDLSDEKLDGKGPTESINYLHHVANIINATMEEVRSA